MAAGNCENVPKFLDENFVFGLVKLFENEDNVELIQWNIDCGSSETGHYASVMFKISASYRTNEKLVEDKRFILKTFPDSGEKKDFLDNVPMFSNEIEMYTKTLAHMESILLRNGDKPWWPKLIYHRYDPPTLVFEDLTQKDFLPQTKPLDMVSMNPVIERIAKYHSLSMVIAESDQSTLVTRFAGTFDATKLRPILGSVMIQGSVLGGAVKSWPGLEKIGHKIESSMDELFENFAKCYNKPSRFGFNVLNHGDFHIRNMMFKRDSEGSIEDIKFVDFQIPLYQSPGFDLVFMMNAIANFDVRKHKEDVLREYHRNLIKNLKLFGFLGKAPTLTDVHVEFMEMAPYDAFQQICFGPLFYLDPDALDISGVLNSKEETALTAVLRKLFATPEFIADTREVLLSLDSLGVFD